MSATENPRKHVRLLRHEPDELVHVEPDGDAFDLASDWWACWKDQPPSLTEAVWWLRDRGFQVRRVEELG